MYPTINQYIDALMAKRSNFSTLRKVKICCDNAGEPIYTTTTTTVCFNATIDGVPKAIRLLTNPTTTQKYAQNTTTTKLLEKELAVLVGDKIQLLDIIIENNPTPHTSHTTTEQIPEIHENRRPQKKDQLWGFVDQNDNWIIQPKYTEVSQFSEGRAVVEIDGMFGLIDNLGNTIIDTIYDELSYDQSHLCYTNKMGKCGVIDRTGKEIVPHNWDWTAEFTHDRLLVQKDMLYGFVDTTGRVVIEPQYTDARPMDHNGYAKVTLQNRTFIIDQDGYEIS